MYDKKCWDKNKNTSRKMLLLFYLKSIGGSRGGGGGFQSYGSQVWTETKDTVFAFGGIGVGTRSGENAATVQVVVVMIGRRSHESCGRGSCSRRWMLEHELVVMVLLLQGG